MKRHPLELFSLVAGITFAGFASLYLVTDGLGYRPQAGAMLSALLIGLGVAGLLAALQAQRRQGDVAADGAESVDGSTEIDSTAPSVSEFPIEFAPETNPDTDATNEFNTHTDTEVMPADPVASEAGSDAQESQR